MNAIAPASLKPVEGMATLRRPSRGDIIPTKLLNISGMETGAGGGEANNPWALFAW
jgi:hypothetical protein